MNIEILQSYPFLPQSFSSKSLFKAHMTNRLALALLTLALSLTGACAAHAQASDGFQSPSKNIACMYFEYDGHKALRCDVGDKSWTPPPKPANCEQDWGNSFEVQARGTAGGSCTGDTQIGQPLAVLPYGEVWQRSGITCKSEQSGVTCFNADRHGFSLSRAKWDVF
jgi:hypothetical protein